MKIVELGDYSMIISEASNIQIFSLPFESNKDTLIINPTDEQITFENTSTTDNFIISNDNIIAYFSYKISNKYKVNQEIEVSINNGNNE